MAISKIKGVGEAVKGFGKAMKSQMRKAFVDKPTFPGPNAINILNRDDNDEIGVASNYNKMRFWSPEFIIKEFDKLIEMGV